MSTHNIPFSKYKKNNQPKLNLICSYGISSKGHINEFEIAVVNKPSVFEPLECDLVVQMVNGRSQVQTQVRPSGDRDTLLDNAAVNGYVFESGMYEAAKVGGWAPPFMCCAQDIIDP